MSAEERIYKIVEQTEISDLLIRYFRALDDKQLDKKTVEATFATDAQVTKHNGSIVTGHDNILDTHLKGFAGFKATHHTVTGFVIDIDNNKAVVKANLTIVQLLAGKSDNASDKEKTFYAGGVLLTKAVKTDHHWRLNEWVFRKVFDGQIKQ